MKPDHGTTNKHSYCCQRAWNIGYNPLVHSTSTTNMVHMETEKDRWIARGDDVHLVYLYVLHCSSLEIERSPPYDVGSVPFGVYAIVQVNQPMFSERTNAYVHHKEFQCPNPDTATDILRLVYRELVSDSHIQ